MHAAVTPTMPNEALDVSGHSVSLSIALTEDTQVARTLYGMESIIARAIAHQCIHKETENDYVGYEVKTKP
jgi:hypothetical protein